MTTRPEHHSTHKSAPSAVRSPLSRRFPAFILAAFALAACERAVFAGTWSALAHPPPAGLNHGLLLSDGTVMCDDGGSGWYRLTPDIHGSYVNGTWTQLSSTLYTRLFYSSQVLTNGNVYVAGGEYGTGGAHAEWYNTSLNVWSEIAQPSADPTYSDAISKMLPNGNVLQGTTGSGVWVYSPATNTIVAAASAARSQDETCWVRMTNDAILTVDGFGQTAEHYVPSLNEWVADPNTPQDLYGYGGELGPGFVLPNGNVFCIGASTATAIYTPGSTATAAGSWVSGPEMIFGTNTVGAVDAPAAMMANGLILCALGPTNGYNGPTTFYTYDYVANAFTQINGPTGLTYSPAPFVTTFLDLPDGSILFFGGQNSTSLFIYFPDGSPLAQGQPAINTITENTNGSYHLTGTGLNGITGGAAYGDDWQMDTSYPLVRMTNNSSSNVYYGRTYNWTSTTIQTGSRVTSTEFTLPPNMPAGTYSLVVAVNGNSSAPTTLPYSPPAAPTGLTAITGNSQLGLSWNSVSGATVYNVLRATASGGPYATLATQTGTNFINTGLTNGITYYYVVVAVGGGGPSAYSAELAAAPFGAPPPPTGLTAGPDSYVGINLNWNPSPGAATYNVKKSMTSGGPYTPIASRPNPNYDDTNVLAGTRYFYVVSAVSAGGESPNSAQVFTTPSATGDVTNGLAGNWRFDDGSGTTAADSSGNNNTGTLINGPTWTSPGRIGPFDLSFAAASDQYVSVADSASLDVTTAITFTAWFNVIDWGGNRRILEKGNSDNQYRFLAENGVFKFDLKGVNTLTIPLPSTNVWVHAAATYNGTTMIIYTNGQPAATMAASGAIATTTDPLAIATKNTSTTAGDYFNGQLDEVRIYNRALSLAEINTVMHAGDAAPTTPTGLSAVATNAQVSLSWTPGTTASSYNVKRSTVSGGPYSVIGTSFASSYTDSGLTNGTTYYYVVSAVNFTNESANSSQISAKPAIGVTFFIDISYTGGASQVLGAGSYTLAQLNAAGMPNDAASSCNVPPGWKVVVYQNDGFSGTTWTLTNDTPNFTLYSGLNDQMSSCIITAGSVPAAPGLNATAGDTQVSLSWNTVSGASLYHLKRSLTNGGPYTVLASTTSTSYTDTGLMNDTNYYYVVSAVNVTGEGANSLQVKATPSLPIIVLTTATPANGQFVFQFPGVNGHNYIVQSSTDLVSWLPIFTNQPSGGVFLYTNPAATNPVSYYRVQQ